MKNKFVLSAAGAVLLAVSVTTFVCTNKSNDSMDDLFKANVEALARNESGNYVMCMQHLAESDHGEKNYYCQTCTLRECGQTSMAMCVPPRN